NTFSGDGYFRANLSDAATNDYGVEVINRPAGGYYLLGAAPLGGQLGLVTTISSITPSGSLAAGFGSGGVMQVPGAVTPDGVAPPTLGRDSQGRLLLASGVTANARQVRVWRITTGGSLDAGFGAGGMRTYSLPLMPGGWDAQAVSLDDLAFDGSGRLV